MKFEYLALIGPPSVTENNFKELLYHLQGKMVVSLKQNQKNKKEPLV